MHLDVIQVGANTHDNVEDYIAPRIIKQNLSAILIEPNKECYNKLTKRYKDNKNIITLNCVVSNKVFENNTAKFYTVRKEESDPYWFDLIHSLDLHFVRSHIAFGLQLGDNPFPDNKIIEVEVPVLSLSDIVSIYNIKSCLELYIDAEGHDWEVLQSYPFDKLHPNKIVLEHTHLSEKRKELFLFLFFFFYDIFKFPTEIVGVKRNKNNKLEQIKSTLL
ncbi:MAG: FkbM family methyltransferase [Romboutsia sp.]|nr:FkbM family methyltransferase [Romboutsia sp.]